MTTTTLPGASAGSAMNDPDAMLKVTNTGRNTVSLTGHRRIYEIQPGQSAFVPFHVCVKHFGDPRSSTKRGGDVYYTPSGERGMIPERRNELHRLSVHYGVYPGAINQIPKVAPKVTISTDTGDVIEFPAHNPSSAAYEFERVDGSVGPEAERARLQAGLDAMRARMDALEQQRDTYGDIEGAGTDEPPVPGL